MDLVITVSLKTGKTVEMCFADFEAKNFETVRSHVMQTFGDAYHAKEAFSISVGNSKAHVFPAYLIENLEMRLDVLPEDNGFDQHANDEQPQENVHYNERIKQRSKDLDLVLNMAQGALDEDENFCGREYCQTAIDRLRKEV